jgi:hypothetical protein
MAPAFAQKRSHGGLILSGPEPESSATNLFNEIGSLELEDVERARTLYLNIRRLRQSRPSSFILSVASVIAALKVGRRDEAIEELGRAYGLRDASEIVGWGALADLNAIVGQLDRSAELYTRLCAFPGALAIPQIVHNAANSALISGSIENLRFLADEDAKLNRPASNASRYLFIIERSGISESFNDHQKIVSSVLRETRTWAEPQIRHEDRDEPTLVIYHWILGDRAARNRLQVQMIDALRAHYRSASNDLSIVLPVLLNRILEAPKMISPVAVAS